MDLKKLTSINLIAMDLECKSKEEAIKCLIEKLYIEGKISSEEEFFRAVMERETLSPTGLEGGLAIPHGKSNFVKQASFAVGILREPIGDWESIDESNNVKYIFLLAIPSTEAGTTHLELLGELMTRISNDDYKEALMNSKTSKEFFFNLDKEMEKSCEEKNFKKSIVAVTACPAGIAHTYMAAEALVKAGKELGVAVYVEKQGAAGIEDKHTKEQLKNADAAIFAVAVAVKYEERYRHLIKHKVSVSEPLKNAKKVILDALEKSENHEKEEYINVDENEEKISQFTIARQALMTGISYIIPLIVAGGMISSLALMFFGIEGVAIDGSTGQIMKVFGGDILKLMVPLLAGYIAYSLGDKPALIPGIAGGIASNTVGGGFIGGIIGGYIAGYFIRWFKTIKVRKDFVGLMNMLVYPLVGTLIVGISMLFVIGKPIGFINTSLINELNSLSGNNVMLLAVLIGAMTCFDLGGPVNKAAFAFSIAAIEAGNGLPYAAFAVAKSMPGIALTIATIIKPRVFNKEDKELGKSSWVIGLCGITETAIPFALADPVVAIPSLMIGGAVGSVISYLSGCSLLAAGGSILTVPVTSNPVMWIVALLVSSVVSALCLIVGKSVRKKKI